MRRSFLRSSTPEHRAFLSAASRRLAMLRLGMPITAAAMAHGLPARVDLAPAVPRHEWMRRGSSAQTSQALGKRARATCA